MINNTVVILNYNDADTVMSLVGKIRNYTVFDRIVVVDNASTDGSFEQLEQLRSTRVHIISSGRNGGYAFGNNFGIFYAIREFNTRYITIANPDIEFEEAAAIALIKYLSKNPACGMVAPKAASGCNAWHLPGYAEIALSLFPLPRWLFKYAYRKSYLDDKHTPVRVGVVEGSFFCIRASLMQDIKGYDERTFLYGEENILAKKVDNTGYQVFILPQYTYCHYHSVSMKKSVPQKRKVFKYKYDSYWLYCKDYLNVSKIKLSFLHTLYWIAYIERVLYDFLFIRKSNG